MISVTKEKEAAIAYIFIWGVLTWTGTQDPNITIVLAMGKPDHVFPLQLLGVALLLVSIYTLIRSD